MSEKEIKQKEGIKSEWAKDKIRQTHKKQSALRKEFMEFINRGSVVDLAVGVAVGGAFTTIVNSLVNDLVMPIVGLIIGGINLTNLSVTVPSLITDNDGVTIYYGAFLQKVVEFLIIAWVIFVIVKAMNKINRKRDKKAD